MPDEAVRLVAEGNVDALVRHVDGLCASQQWEQLADLRHRCRQAYERGHQLWPISSLAEYRLALLAPAQWAATVLTDGTGVLALGPLAEVAASTHSFIELAPHLVEGPTASVLAHERVVRGEDLRAAAAGPWGHLIADSGVPLQLQAWEPDYPLATYHDTSAEFAGPPVVRCTTTVTAPAASELASDTGVLALRELVSGWADTSATSAGVRARVAVVDGDAAGAVAAVVGGEARMAPLTAAQALATMAWAAASGGDTGRRRGMARGRFEALWAVAALGGCESQWPLPPDELGAIAADLQWWAFDHGTPDDGWHLCLAVDDAVDGLAWAIDAGGPTAR
jgi:hypothetical protein